MNARWRATSEAARFAGVDQLVMPKALDQALVIGQSPNRE